MIETKWQEAYLPSRQLLLQCQSTVYVLPNAQQLAFHFMKVNWTGWINILRITCARSTELRLPGVCHTTLTPRSVAMITASCLKWNAIIIIPKMTRGDTVWSVAKYISLHSRHSHCASLHNSDISRCHVRCPRGCCLYYRSVHFYFQIQQSFLLSCAFILIRLFICFHHVYIWQLSTFASKSPINTLYNSVYVIDCKLNNLCVLY